MQWALGRLGPHAMSKLANRLEEWRAKQAEIAKYNTDAPKAGSSKLLAARLRARLSQLPGADLQV